MTDKISRFLREEAPPSPCLVVDLDVVTERYRQLRQAMPFVDIYYAVKANPAAEILTVLEAEGAFFDVASMGEIEACLQLGLPADRLSFGNTIKKESDIAKAFQLGLRLFSFDSAEELEKLARAAPGAKVVCRLLTDGTGAEWPLSRKFGCTPDMAFDLLADAAEMGLTPWGVTFHVGSQQMLAEAWDTAIAQSAELFARLERIGIVLKLLNMGGGLPAKYREDVPAAMAYGEQIRDSLTRHFGNRMPQTVMEPGRYLVGDAGVIEAEVVLVSKKGYGEETRWVYLDVGRFTGLVETENEAIKYKIRTDYGTGTDDQRPQGPVVIAGPTCDSLDIMYEKTRYELPLDLKAGDRVQIYATGAYTSTCSSVGFNGFPALKSYFV